MYIIVNNRYKQIGVLYCILNHIRKCNLTNLFIAAVAAEYADESEQTNTETGQPFLPWMALPVDDEPGAPPGTDVPNIEYNI